MNKSILILLFILSSCGLRLTKEVDKNLLLGKWEMEFIKCYKTKFEESELEKYRLTGEVSGEIEFTDGKINYSAKGDTCTTSSTGDYKVTYSAQNVGVVEIQNPVVGGKCAESVVDSRSTQAHSIDFDMDTSIAKSLAWKILDTNYLVIDFFTKFKGSSLSNFCLNSCHCRLELKKF